MKSTSKKMKAQESQVGHLWRLAQAATMIDCGKRNIELPLDKDGTIIPSDEALQKVLREHRSN